MKKRCALFFATGCFVGYVPFAPGTWASVLTVLLWWLLPPLHITAMLVVFLFLFCIGVWTSSIVEEQMGLQDPGAIVIDEFAGMMLALIALPKTVPTYVTAFLLFRFFDVVKPFPINVVETKFSRGWAIMLDDVAAGVMTWLMVQVIRWFWIG